jgi:hypothetical protein
MLAMGGVVVRLLVLPVSAANHFGIVDQSGSSWLLPGCCTEGYYSAIVSLTNAAERFLPLPPIVTCINLPPAAHDMGRAWCGLACGGARVGETDPSIYSVVNELIFIDPLFWLLLCGVYSPPPW